MKFTSTVAALAILVCCSCSHGEHNLQVAASELKVVPTAKVRRASITSETALTAEFEPFQEIDVMAKVAGYVRSIKVDLGDHVREGQLLALLEIPEMQDDLSKAAAMLEQSDAEIGAARDDLARAESAHQIAHLSFTRIQEVAKKEAGLIPQQEVDEAHSRDLVSEAQVASARSKLRAAQQQSQVARADQARVRTMHGYISITAPFAGTITRRYANTGAMIQAGTASQSQAMPLVKLTQTSVLRLSVPVPESMVSTIHIGAPVEVHVSSLNRDFAGRICRFAGKVDRETRTMSTEIDVPNPQNVLLPGMYAEVRLRLQEHHRVLSVPLEAIERSGSSTRVYRVEKTGEVKVVPVQLGVENAQRAEVVAGVAEGDDMIIGRRNELKEGEKVRPRIVDTADRAGIDNSRM